MLIVRRFEALWLMAILLSGALLPAQSSGSALRGCVRDVTGAFFSGATVTLLDSRKGTLRTAKAGSGGEYSFGGLPTGKYELRVEGAGFLPAVHVMWIPPRTELTMDSVLNPAPTHGYGDVFVMDKKKHRIVPDSSEYRGAVRGRALSQFGDRVAGAQVVAENVDSHESRSTKTRQDGGFALDGLPKGFYKVHANCKGYWPDFRTARIDYGLETEIELELEIQ